MTLNKAARKMVYEGALTEKSNHPDWTTHTCLEESFIKCAGFSNYNYPLKTMLPEYQENPDGEISSFLNQLYPKP